MGLEIFMYAELEALHRRQLDGLLQVGADGPMRRLEYRLSATKGEIARRQLLAFRAVSGDAVAAKQVADLGPAYFEGGAV